MSTDDGRSWAWLSAERVQGASFAYAFPPQSEAVRFCLAVPWDGEKSATGPFAVFVPPPRNTANSQCFVSRVEQKCGPKPSSFTIPAVPYQASHLDAWLERQAADPHLRVEHHATTRKGSKTRRLRLGRIDGPPRFRVLLTARHHCCEMMAGYTLEGIADAVLGKTDLGAWFRAHVELAAVPLMDKDGVEDGDQGKNRHPHDHNRDYQGESIYPAVAALKQFVPPWSDGKLRIALDLHCPWIRGGNNEQIFFAGNRSPEMWQRQQRFSHLLQQVQTGPLVHDPRHNIPWGQGWNTNPLDNTCSAWMALQPGVSVSSTLEIPYANAGGKPVTAASARRLGHDLAAAIRRYLESA